MNKKHLKGGFGVVAIVVTLAIVLVAGGGTVYTVKKVKQNKETKTAVDVNSDAQAEVSNNKKSLKDILALGQSQVCNMIQVVGDSVSDSTFYIADGKMRGDITTRTATSADVMSHMIIDGEYMQAWTDKSKQGFKMKMTSQSQAQTNANTPDLNQELAYDCRPWMAEAGKFTPPSTITFTELNTNTSVTAPGANINVNLNGTVKLDR
jgi:hypothetical protein